MKRVSVSRFSVFSVATFVSGTTAEVSLKEDDGDSVGSRISSTSTVSVQVGSLGLLLPFLFLLLSISSSNEIIGGNDCSNDRPATATIR